MPMSLFRARGVACAAGAIATLLWANVGVGAAESANSAAKCRSRSARAVLHVQADGGGGETQEAKGTTPWALPDYWALRMPQHEAAIGLSDDQKAKLQEIGEAYRQAMQAAYAPIREAKPEQRAKLAETAQQKVAEARETARQKVQAVLTREQIAKCEDIQFRAWAGSMLRNAQVQEKLGLTGKQKKKIDRAFAKHQQLLQKTVKRQRELQQAANEKAIETLTEEQVEKLKQKQLETMSHHTYLLRPNHGAKELGLTEKQQARIEKIGDQWQETMREMWQGLKDVQGAERAEAMKQIREKTAEMTATMRAAIRDVLTSEQLDKAKDALFKTYGSMTLRHPTMATGIDLTEKQRERIDAAYAGLTEKAKAMGAKARDAYQKATEQGLELLTAEQVEKLKEIQKDRAKPRVETSQQGD